MGELDGVNDGIELGAMVGMSITIKEGDNVGVTVVGETLGVVEGIRVDGVGFVVSPSINVGKFVGDSVGAHDVGVPVGGAEGSCVGDKDD